MPEFRHRPRISIIIFFRKGSIVEIIVAFALAAWVVGSIGKAGK
jgi:hypothetical protein